MPVPEPSSIITQQQLTKSRWLSLLVPMASIGFILFVLIGMLMNLSYHAIEDLAKREVEERMLGSVSQMAQQLTNELQQVERLGDLLAEQTKILLSNPDKNIPDKLLADLQQSPGGVSFSSATNQTAIFLAFQNKLNKTIIKKKLQQLSVLSPLLKNIYNSHSLINMAYFNNTDSATIVFPWLDIANVFPKSNDIKGLEYYKAIDEENALQSKPVWINNYFDLASKSKTLTLIQPIIQQDKIDAVIGLNVSLDALEQYLAKMTVPWGGYSLLINAEGELLVFPSQAVADWQDINNLAKNTNFEGSNFLQQPLLLNQLDPLRLDASGLVTLKLNNQNLLLSWSSVTPMGWKLLNVAALDKVFMVKNQLTTDYRLVLFLVGSFLIVMFLLLFFLVRRRDKNFVISSSTELLKKEKKKPAIAITDANMSQAEFMTIVSGPIIVCQFDKDELIIACNSAFEHLAGSTQSSLKGRHLFDLLNLKDQPINNQVKEIELCVAQQEKSSYWISLHYSVNGEGLLLLLDISESKQIEQQLRGDRQRARLAAKMKAEFFQVAVSDANVLLLELLQNARGFDESLTNYCQAKLIEIQHLLDNMRDMSDAGEVDQQELSEDTLVLSSLVNDCYTASESLLANSDRRLLIEYGSNIPEYLVLDRRRLFRLMRHLLRQMVQLSAKGDIHLWLGWNALGRLQLKIHDQGGGLAENERLKRFQLTTPINNRYETTSGALGLGQLLTRQLVHEMRGCLEVEALSTGGLQLQIEIPAHLGNKVEELILGRLLVVDDGPVNTMLASSVLEKSGYKVDVANSGAEALVLGKQKNYDLVLMDIFMPDMDGIETTRQWRKLIHNNAKVPIIALTAYALEVDREHFLAEGIDDCLTKPYRPNELRELVQFWLQKK